MRKNFWIVVLFITALSILPSCTAMAAKDKEKEGEEKDEVKVKIDQVPAAVKKTLDKESDNAKIDEGRAAGKKTLEKEAENEKIDEVNKETDDGKTIYEADVKMNGHNYEIKVAEDGTLISKKLDEGEGEEKGEGKGKEKEEDEAKEKK